MKRLLLIFGIGLGLLLCWSIPSHAAIAHTKLLGTSSNSNCTNVTTTITCTFTNAYAFNATTGTLVFVTGAANNINLTNVSASATNVTFTKVGSITGPAANQIQTFTATSADTATHTYTVVWTCATTCSAAGFGSLTGDEFSGVNSTPIDNHQECVTGGTGCGTTACHTSGITPVANNVAIWAACQDSVTVQTGNSFLAGGNDASGDDADYKIISGGAGVSQAVNGLTGSGTYTVNVVTLAPAAAGGAAPPTRTLMGVGQ